MMKFPTYGNIIHMFQTTNQDKLTPSPKIGIESNFDHGIEFASNLEGPG
jgi:hypothetical protein